MKQIGLIKEIDKLGRLGIPKEVRKRMGLSGKVELIMTKDGLLIRKFEGGKERKSKLLFPVLTNCVFSVIIMK